MVTHPFLTAVQSRIKVAISGGLPLFASSVIPRTLDQRKQENAALFL